MSDVLIEMLKDGLMPIVASYITFLFTRRKYKAEVDAMSIDNMQKRFEMYDNTLEASNKLIKDLREEIEGYKDQQDEYMVEVTSLKRAILKLIETSCTDQSCIKRKMVSEEEARDLLGID